eukprot:6196082-Pleurochrysis_carterae.AAC.1
MIRCARVRDERLLRRRAVRQFGQDALYPTREHNGFGIDFQEPIHCLALVPPCCHGLPRLSSRRTRHIESLCLSTLRIDFKLRSCGGLRDEAADALLAWLPQQGSRLFLASQRRALNLSEIDLPRRISLQEMNGYLAVGEWTTKANPTGGCCAGTRCAELFQPGRL